MLSTKKAAIFDCDGTLIHSLDDVCTCINEALAKINCKPLDKAVIQRLVGPDLVKTIGYEVAEDHFDFDEFIEHYVAIYNKKSVLNTSLYSGVKDTLERLKRNNFILAVYSNKPAAQSRPILENLSISTYFDEIIGPDTFSVAKPDPEGVLYVMRKYDLSESDLVFVGDTLTDIHTANNAVVDCVSVSYGYERKETLKKHNSFHVIDHIEELFTL